MIGSSVRSTFSYHAVCVQKDWTKTTVRDGLPEQHDGGSCGVFACQYAKRLLAGAQVQNAFSQQDIPELRLQMASDLLDAYWQPNAGIKAF